MCNDFWVTKEPFLSGFFKIKEGTKGEADRR